MATYIELRNLFDDDTLKNRMDAAIVIAAKALLDGTPTTADQKWAAAVAANPRAEGKKAYMFVIADNKDNTVSQIKSASDIVLQTAVDAVVPSLVVAHGA